MDFHSTWTNRRRIRLSFRARLISSRGIPRRAGEEHPCRSGRPTGHTRAPRPYVTSVPAGSVRRDPREAISSIYRQRLHGSFAKAPLAPWTRGFRRARHFTYVAECPRANISSANVTLHWVDILVADFGSRSSFCRRWYTAFRASSIHALRPYWRTLRPRHLIEKPHTKWTTLPRAHVLALPRLLVEISPEAKRTDRGKLSAWKI